MSVLCCETLDGERLLVLVLILRDELSISPESLLSRLRKQPNPLQIPQGVRGRPVVIGAAAQYLVGVSDHAEHGQ